MDLICELSLWTWSVDLVYGLSLWTWSVDCGRLGLTWSDIVCRISLTWSVDLVCGLSL